MDPQSTHRHRFSEEVASSSPGKSGPPPASPSTNSSSSLSNYLDRTTPTSTVFPSTSPTLVSPPSQGPAPTRSISASTPTSSSTANGERTNGERAKRHSLRQPPPPLQPVARQSSFPSNNSGQPPSAGLERTFSNHSSTASVTQPRPTSPVTSPSIHKSLNALDAKAITRDMERSTQYMRGDDMLTSPSSPTGINSGFYFPPSTSPVPPNATPYMRQGSISNPTVPNTIISSAALNAPQGDVWQNLCVRVLPLFNGEGVKGNIEDLNELFRRCLSEPLSPQLYRDIEALLRDGMFTLNSKMLGVTDEKLLDRLVEQWSFFFTYALPYFEAVFLPLRTDVRYRSVDDAEMWNVRNMALRSFRDNVILLQTKRLEDVFAKLFTDFGSSQNPAATAAKMLQMTSLLASAPDHNEEIERVLSSLQANWKIMMTKGDRRGFAGVRKARTGFASDSNPNNQIFGSLP